MQFFMDSNFRGEPMKEEQKGKIVANTPVSKNSNTSSSFKIRENHLGSEINYNKRIKPINRQNYQWKIEKVVILYKSCLIRFGYELSETLCNIWYRIQKLLTLQKIMKI